MADTVSISEQSPIVSGIVASGQNIVTISAVTEADTLVVIELAPKDTIVVSDNTIRGQRGIQGPVGESPHVSVYTSASASLAYGVLQISVADATTFRVLLDENVNDIIISDWPPDGKSQRVVIYFKQDEVGGRVVQSDAWPLGTIWNDGARPDFSRSPGDTGCILLDTFDSGTTIYGNIIGYNYY